MNQRIQLQLLVKNKQLPLKIPAIKRICNRILKLFSLEGLFDNLPPAVQEVSIVLSDDDELQSYNKHYLKKDRPTDVLSFSQLEGPEAELASSLGDLIISTAAVKRQAKKFDCTISQELSRLVIHGLLHLLGMEHERVSKSRAQQMRRLERKLLSLLKLEKP